MADYKVRLKEEMHFCNINSIEELNKEINDALKSQLAAGDGVEYEWEDITEEDAK